MGCERDCALEQLQFVWANLGALNDFEVNSVLWPHSEPNTNLQGYLQTIKMIWVLNLQQSATLWDSLILFKLRESVLNASGVAI